MYFTRIAAGWHIFCNACDVGRQVQTAFAGRNTVIMISRPEFAEFQRDTGSGIPGPCDGRAKPSFSWPANEIMLRSLVRTGHNFAEIGALHGVDDVQIAELRNRYDV